MPLLVTQHYVFSKNIFMWLFKSKVLRISEKIKGKVGLYYKSQCNVAPVPGCT